MTAIKKTAARMYLDTMPDSPPAVSNPRPTIRPVRLIGGCLLYRLPLRRKQQHPPTPYYS